MSEWQEKDYIRKITKEYYIFSDLEINESVLFLIANKIYTPSYISFEMAFSYYNLIPESVYGVTSASSKKTNYFKTDLAEFIYHSLKPELMFGYKLVEYQGHYFKIEEIEEFNNRVDREKLKRYLKAFANKSLEERINNFLKYIDHA